MEEWKDVVGWNGKYKVSNLGRVWNTLSDVEVAQVIAGIPQYLYVNLNSGGQYKLERLHRVVAKAFCINDNPELFDIVDHIDRDKFNNTAHNLRWTDHSGNQKNTDNSRYIGDVHIKDYVLKYDNPDAAYHHIYTSLTSGLSDQEAVDRYEEFLEYGLLRRKVLWNDEDVYLTDLCFKYGKKYLTVSNRLNRGWNILHSICDINIEHINQTCFEVQGKGGVVHWFPSKEYFARMHKESLCGYLDSGLLYEDILKVDGKDHLRQTVRGITGTIKELCNHFEASEGAVLTNMLRKDMSLEEALFAPRQRVKRLSINGVYNSPKYWYESFGINAKAANKYKSEKKLTFKQALQHFGIDTSEMIISLV